MHIIVGRSSTAPDHLRFITRITDLVERDGPDRALELLDGVVVPAVGRPHRTVTVFLVWAVDHLLRHGLERWQVLWHPLVAPGAVLAWYDRETLASFDAHDTFVAPHDQDDTAPLPFLPLAVAS